MRLRGRRRRDRAGVTAFASPVAQENGVLVDELCRTSAADVYAAGDVANQLHPLFGRVRVEHYNNAEKMGQAVARSMLGSTSPYDYVHSFWSDQYDHKLEYVGHATNWDDFVVRGSLEEGKLIGFYLRTDCCRRPSGSTAAATLSWTPTRRWRHARASWHAGPARRWPARRRAGGPVVARGLTGGRRRWLGVREQGDVRATGRRERAVEQRDDQLADIGGCEAGTQRGIGLTQHLGVDGARTQADGGDPVLPCPRRRSPP